jgi:hypothetical protein
MLDNAIKIFVVFVSVFGGGWVKYYYDKKIKGLKEEIKDLSISIKIDLEIFNTIKKTVDLIFACDIDHGELNEKAKSTVTIDLSTLKVEKSTDHTNKIELFGTVGVVMKYPTVDVIKKLEGFDTNDLDTVFDIMALSIDYIYDGDNLFYAKEQTQAELLQFIENLSSEQFAKVQKFFETMPKITKQIEYDCPICSKHHVKVLEGLQSFF